MIKMVEKWIHRECERDVADLVQPTQSWSGGPCAVCGQIFGVVWLNEVAEAVSVPSAEIMQEVIADTKTYLKTQVEEIFEEPELEVIAVLEEASVPSVEEVDKLAEPARAFEILHETEAALEAIEKEAVSEPSKEVHTVGGNEFAEEPELEVVAVLEPAVIEEIEEANKKEDEIAALKAQIAELEK